MVIVVMGVTGAGKTTLGLRLAEALGWRFHDADDFHPEPNKAKMHAGIPLTDEDRWPWLRALRAVIEQALADDAGGITGVVVLSESHLAVHTFPERGFAAVNLYCCRPRAPWPWAQGLGDALGATEVLVSSHLRGRTASVTR